MLESGARMRSDPTHAPGWRVGGKKAWGISECAMLEAKSAIDHWGVTKTVLVSANAQMVHHDKAH